MRQTVSTAARHNGYYARKWRGETSGANEFVDDKEGSVLCGFLWEIQCGMINKTANELVKVVKNFHVGYLHRLLHNQNLSMLVT
ncbi:hypothetical protein BDZ91DRAFT_724359 [Kalaharituber pfeilii]|nr:hypothetical protein BDZ91DRAFT_724359 [Kalaharituber pfeilii]